MKRKMRRLAVALYLLLALLTVADAVRTPVKGEASRFVLVAPGIAKHTQPSRCGLRGCGCSSVINIF